MKLLQELLSLTPLSEEAIEVREASDVWAENKDSAKTYVTKTIFQVKETEDEDGMKQYEVYSDTTGTRKLINTLSPTDFKAAYSPIRSNQEPDAEGFTLYREDAEVEAFKYEGDTIKVNIDGDKETLRKGMYVIRREEDDSFTYSVETAKYFEADYTEKK
jgi:hypothetical protein